MPRARLWLFELVLVLAETLVLSNAKVTGTPPAFWRSARVDRRIGPHFRNNMAPLKSHENAELSDKKMFFVTSGANAAEAHALVIAPAA